MSVLRRCSDITLLIALVAWLAGVAAPRVGHPALGEISTSVFAVSAVAAAALWCVYCIARLLAWIQGQKGEAQDPGEP